MDLCDPCRGTGVVQVSKTALILLIPLLGADTCLAGWISEVQPFSHQVFDITHTQVLDVPPLVELSGLGGAGVFELVILDAGLSPEQTGRVLQTIAFTTGTDVHVVAEEPLPQQLASGNARLTTLDQSQTLDLSAGPRSLLLFDGLTGLVPNSGQLQNLALNAGVNLLDVITFGPSSLAGSPGSPTPTNSAQAYEDEPVLVVQTGEAISRPMANLSQPADRFYLTGTPNLEGALLNDLPEYRLNPGLVNLELDLSSSPEPGCGAILLIGQAGWWLLSRRRETVRHWQSGSHCL